MARKKRDSRKNAAVPLRVVFIFCFFVNSSLAPAADRVDQLSEKLNDCNWLVNYRGVTYDLAPLTREALSRPIESDIRYALQRVPESNRHLEEMSSHLRDAKAHTILASIFVSGVLLTRILQSRQKNSEVRRSYDVITGTGAGFFLAATIFSFKATREAKKELVLAVDAFNQMSSQKIEPASTEKTGVDYFAPAP